jgi:signal peptidase
VIPNPLRTTASWRSVAHAVGTAVLLAAVVVVAITAVPALVGAEQSYVVKSNSMAPSIDAGAVVYVAETDPATLAVGDVVSFEHDGDGPVITHRIVEVVSTDDGRAFRTRGDANDVADGTLVAPADVIGRVTFHLPYVGYLVSLAGTTTGMIAFVVVPGVLLAVNECWRLYREGRAHAAEAERGGDG